MAYNGHVAMSLPCETDFKGCVPGLMLISSLKALSAKEVEFEEDKEVLRMRCGATKMVFATLDVKAYLDQFTMPKAPTASLRVDPDAFIKSVSLCLRSVSTDTSVPDQLGVSLITNKYGFELFGTNNATLARAELRVEGDNPLPKRAILPALFCKQLVALHSKGSKLKLDVTDKAAMYGGADGLRMHGNLIESERPLDLSSTFDRYHPPTDDDKLYPVAEKLANVLERACIIASSAIKTVQTRIVVKDGKASFTTKSDLHEVRDTMDMSSKQPDVDMQVDPKWVRAGVDDFKRMLITNFAFVMENKTGYYIVSGKGS